MGDAVADAREWDRFYAGDGRDVPHWSGQPNSTLVAEASDLRAGRALDVGCGEGADAIWLAERGWRVTAIDPSRIALDRAAESADAAGVEVAWVAAGLLDLRDDRAYDLVAAHYPVLLRDPEERAIDALLRRVAPGGTLLFVHHEPGGPHRDGAHHHGRHDAGRSGDDGPPAGTGIDPMTYVMPKTVAAALDEGWEVEVLEARVSDRAHHDGPAPRDLVLRARRIPPGD